MDFLEAEVSMKEDPIFQPIRIGALVLPNRVVMTAVKLGYAPPTGAVTDRHIAFYARRAEGGVGLLTTEPLYVQRNGRELPTQLGAHEDSLVAGLASLVRGVHAAGGRITAHLNHAGRAANPKLVPEGNLVSASDVLCPANQGCPRPLSLGEIGEVVRAFADASRRVREAGFDAVEIPFSHGYLIHQFLSPHTNRREDDYGGSFEERTRFGREVLDAVRGEVGMDFPIVVRLNAVDYVEGGLDMEDAILLADHLADWGADVLSVTSGTMCESVPFCLYPAGTPEAHLLPMAARVRDASTLPVVVAGRIRSPAVARKALEAGQTDLIGLGRPFLADPDWVRKAEVGDEDGILLCAACHQGCLGELRKGAGTHCLFNPLTGRESEAEMVATTRPRQVVVVGGGPAGLEAAYVAATRGHRVSLFEERGSLGGQLSLAARVPHKEGFGDVIRQLALMAERVGVGVHLGTRISSEELLAGGADAVILATGATPLSGAIPGAENMGWFLASEVLEEEVEVKGESVLLIGGGLVGLEVADFLSAQGRRVVLVEIEAEVGTKLDPLPRAMLLKRLKDQGVEIHRNTKVTHISDGQVLATKGGEELRIAADAAVLAVGFRSDRELADSLEGTGLEVHVIGDAVEPRGAGDAIREGFEIAAKL